MKFLFLHTVFVPLALELTETITAPIAKILIPEICLSCYKHVL